VKISEQCIIPNESLYKSESFSIIIFKRYCKLKLKYQKQRKIFMGKKIPEKLIGKF
jgi:hypothetical protein